MEGCMRYSIIFAVVAVSFFQSDATAVVSDYERLNAPPEEQRAPVVLPALTDESYIVSSELDRLEGWKRLPRVKYGRVLRDVVFREKGVARYNILGNLGRGETRIGPNYSQNDLAASAGEWRGTQRLDMQGNDGITDISAIAGASARSLKALWLSRNNLTQLPEGIERMTGLEKLCLDTNQLTSIQRLSTLRRLKEKLCLRDNRLTNLSVLAQMPALRAVDAGQNHFRRFEASWIAQGGNLIRIDVDAEVELPVAWCRRRFLPANDKRPLIVKSGDNIFVSNPHEKPLDFEWIPVQYRGRNGQLVAC